MNQLSGPETGDAASANSEGPATSGQPPRPSALKSSTSKEGAEKTKGRRRITIEDPADDPGTKPKAGFLVSSSSFIGRTPRTKAAVEQGIHTVDSTDGVKLCVKSWPGHLTETDQGVAAKKLLLVLVHQYSVLGGCQDLLAGLAHHLNALSFSCITFDQRGVGQSSGTKSLTGQPEVNDVVSVCQWAHEKYGRRLLLVGSSAGAPIAGSALDQLDCVDGFVAIGYVFGMWASMLFGSHFQRIIKSPKPKLFIMGSKDGFTTPEQLKSKIAGAEGVAEVHIVDDVGHFELESPSYDEPMAKLVVRFAERAQDLGDSI